VLALVGAIFALRVLLRRILFFAVANTPECLSAGFFFLIGQLNAQIYCIRTRPVSSVSFAGLPFSTKIHIYKGCLGEQSYLPISARRSCMMVGCMCDVVIPGGHVTAPLLFSALCSIVTRCPVMLATCPHSGMLCPSFHISSCLTDAIMHTD
jgi:hypothetical protein